MTDTAAAMGLFEILSKHSHSHQAILNDGLLRSSKPIKRRPLDGKLTIKFKKCLVVFSHALAGGVGAWSRSLLTREQFILLTSVTFLDLTFMREFSLL